MKRKDIQLLHSKTLSELQARVKELQKELFDAKMQAAMRQEKNVRKYKILRHNLARYMTIIRTKQLEQN